MPCDVPARAYTGMPELQVIRLAGRYILVLSADQHVGRSASTQALPGWGWADEGHDGLGHAIWQAGLQQRFHGITIYRRVDGVMVAAGNAAQRRRLMTHADWVEWARRPRSTIPTKMKSTMAKHGTVVASVQMCRYVCCRAFRRHPQLRLAPRPTDRRHALAAAGNGKSG